MKILAMQLGPIETNCYIVYDEDTREAMIGLKPEDIGSFINLE